MLGFLMAVSNCKQRAECSRTHSEVGPVLRYFCSVLLSALSGQTLREIDSASYVEAPELVSIFRRSGPVTEDLDSPVR